LHELANVTGVIGRLHELANVTDVIGRRINAEATELPIQADRTQARGGNAPALPWCCG
jgi:hypothetical protein